MATLTCLLLGLCATVVLSKNPMEDAMEVCADKIRSCKSRRARGYCKASSSMKEFMEKNCRKSCGICKGGTVNTDKPIPPPTPACTDTASVCSRFKSRGYCSSNNYYHRRFMNRYCKESCGKCGATMASSDAELQGLYNHIGGQVATEKRIKPTTRPPTTPACADKNYHCPTWRLQGWCKQIFRKRFMEENCRQSCRMCGACADTTWHCSSWQSRGWCKNSRYKKFMEVNCKKTCGICGGGKVTTYKPTQPSTPPRTTPACADKYRSCPTWRSLGFCKDIRYKRLMEKYCRKSCEMCGGSVTTHQPTQRTKEGPTHGPTEGPTLEPTEGPTEGPTGEPREGTTGEPTEGTTGEPTEGPTGEPTEGPTGEPTEGPTVGPREGPTGEPTEGPTVGPREGTTGEPTEGPTVEPREGPTGEPTEGPTVGPREGTTEGPTVGPTEGQY